MMKRKQEMTWKTLTLGSVRIFSFAISASRDKHFGKQFISSSQAGTGCYFAKYEKTGLKDSRIKATEGFCVSSFMFPDIKLNVM